MNENNMARQAMLDLGKMVPELRIFRNNTGQAWQGETIFKDAHTITLANYRPIHMGLVKGGSDFIGLLQTLITQDMVGTKVALFTALESKGFRGRLTPEQVDFINFINNFGGIAGMFKSTDEAINILSKYKKR